MKKRFAIILTAAALSMTGCSLLGQDTYYIDQGMEQINSGNYEEALTSFSSAEQEGKHLVESYRGSGMAYMALGEYDKAVEAFDRAVDLTKEKQKDVRKDILMYKATALYQSGDYEGAAKVCESLHFLILPWQKSPGDPPGTLPDQSSGAAAGDLYSCGNEPLLLLQHRQWHNLPGSVFPQISYLH